MKKAIYLFAILVFLISCKKEPVVSPAPMSSDTDTLDGLIPVDLYRDSAQAIFIDLNGKEKVFEIQVVKQIEENEEGTIFSTENTKIELREATGQGNYYFSINTHYNLLFAENNATSFVDIRFHAKLKGSYPPPSISILPDSTSAFSGFEEELNLLEKTFRQAYASIRIETFDYVGPQIFYTLEKGVVGFWDDRNVLWVLDRIE